MAVEDCNKSAELNTVLLFNLVCGAVTDQRFMRSYMALGTMSTMVDNRKKILHFLVNANENKILAALKK